MPSRLGVAAATAAAALGMAFVSVLGVALGACIDGEGLDLERAAGADATTLTEASAPHGDSGPRAGDSGCSANLATDPLNCGVCGNVCTVPHALDAGADAEAGEDAEAGAFVGVSTVVASCASSTCTVACAPGRADCNGNMADGCEVSVLADPRNCGGCAVSCGSQACDAGACPYGVLIEDGGAYTELAVNDTVIVAGLVAPVSGVIELSKDGGAEAYLSHGNPTAGLALDTAGHVVFSDVSASAIEQAALAVPLEAGAPGVVYGGITSPRDLTYGSGALVWSQAYADGNETAPSQSGIFTVGPTLIVSSTSFVKNIATTSTSLYFAGQNWIASPPLLPAAAPAESVYGCGLASCPAPGLVAGNQYRVFDVATDGKNLFWTAWGNVSNVAGVLMACSLVSTCTPAAIASNLARPEALVSDGSTVYWYELGLAAIRSLPIPAAGAGAGVPTTVASGVVGVTNLALDRTYIYWDQPGLGEIDRARR